MLATALSQLRYATSVVRNRRINLRDVHRLAVDLGRTTAEFGPVSAEQRENLAIGALDADVRALVDTKRLRAAAVTAAAQTPFYGELFRRLGLEPGSLSIERLGDWPVTPKDALRAMPEAFVSRRSRPTHQVSTTGTTGRPTTVWLSDYELELAAGLAATSMMSTFDLRPDDVFHLALSSRATLSVIGTMRACRLVGAVANSVGLVEPAEALTVLSRTVRLPGKRPRASFLSTYPSYLAALLQEAQRLGYRREDFGLRRILCGGEVLTDALRERVMDFFGADVVDVYGMTETFPVGAMVCGQRHLHWSPEQGHFEQLDPRSWTPAAPGQLATLVITPFQPYRETTLVFRLVTGDLVRPLPEGSLQCDLARMPAASRVLGRMALATTSGEEVITTRDVLDLLEAEPAVPLPARYAVVPASDGADLHVWAPAAGHRMTARLEERIAAAGVPVRRLLLHDDPSDLPATLPVRADLREATFTRHPAASSFTAAQTSEPEPGSAPGARQTAPEPVR